MLIEEIKVSIVAPENLVLSKLVWMKDSQSEIQRRDIESLLRSIVDLDQAYIEKWASDLGVSTLWQEIRT